MQVCPAEHVPQLFPLEPQAEPLCWAVATHLVPWQQPPGHDVALQTHAPAVPQVRPAPQLAQAAPAAPHCAPVCEA
ncbi:MAG TPA: hypothetical protein VHO67_03350 [Polyangia bacterium]|nr:hypothetical protein [Polyangia bacterium]